MDYRIDELAQAAGTTVRNVRAYQDKGLLPPPRREGRVGWYSEAHLARLRVINTLLERGYSLGNIAELLQTWEAGGDMRALLGLEEAITSPFTDEAPDTIDLVGLAQLFGTADPLAIAKATRLGLLVPDGAVFRVPSMRLLRAGAELHRGGIPLDALLDEFRALRRDVDHIAERFVRLVVREVFDKHKTIPRGRVASELADLIRRVRPLAEVVVDTELAHALERHIREGLGDQLAKYLEMSKPRRP